MSGFIGMPRMEDIKRMDAELDRIRWYLSALGSAFGDIPAERIVRALKTGDASVAALVGGEDEE